MKKLFILTLSIFTMGAIHAQEGESFQKHILSIQAGLAIPSDNLSEVSKSDLNSSTAAASASSGITAGIDYQHNVSKYFGINVLLRAYSFPVDENTTLGEFKDDFSNDPAAVYNIDSEPYVLGFLGLGFTAQYGQTVQGYVSPFVGYGGMRSPEIVVGQTVGVNYDKLTQDYSSDLSVMYGGDFGIRVKLSEVLFLGVNGEYLAASDFEFDGDKSRQENNDPKTATPYEYEQPFSTLSVSLKIGFTF